MAVILNTKPRLRLPPGDLPEPKLVRSRSWLPYYVALWICAVTLGHGIVYGWLPFQHQGAVTVSKPQPEADYRGANFEAGLVARAEAPLQPKPVVAPAMPRVPVVPKPTIDLDHLPSCEASSEQEPNEPESRGLLPVDLSRSAVGKLLEFSQWTRPCRGRHAARVHLCLALKSGNILGATAHADPPDPSLERCVVRAASLVDFEPEDTLRIVRLDVQVARER